MSGLSLEYDFVHCAFASPEALLPPEEKDAARCRQYSVHRYAANVCPPFDKPSLGATKYRTSSRNAITPPVFR
jgi:hypothetical protein